MQPHDAAAHQIAKHLRAIAQLMPTLQGHGANAVLSAFLQGQPFTTHDARIAFVKDAATALEASAPFEPATEAEQQAVYEQVLDETGDLSSRERAELVCGEWTEAEWRMEVDDRNEYMADA